ncbi:putative dCMP deaminase [Aureococcus anophagefferens virus]|uniref:Putative dCMP deaminase n=1 Tax=Aureococcus anophagefferens virus TaxID=1474867 RepID=A0A076FMN8_9VIRU|nr:putative dCMP deaminase [Aureococcus anophagefferens virus]AII17188.1 putative dCMP deaminase [Aureococcus anophagefferens virus]
MSSLGGCKKYCNCVTRHAEVDCISKIKNKKKLKKSTLFSVRYAKDDNGDVYLANAKPCEDCKKIALSFGIKSVVFSNSEGVLEKANLATLDTKLTVGSILERNSRNTHQIKYQISKTKKKS